MSFLSTLETIATYTITPLLIRKLEQKLAPPQKGYATTQRNPIAPWSIGYGRIRVGGTLIYDQQWGNNNQMRDMVIELAANQCQIDANHPITLLLDMQRVQIDTTAVPTSARKAATAVLKSEVSYRLCSSASLAKIRSTVRERIK